MDDSKTRYCFLAEWFDVHAQLTRQYELLFYPSDSSVEMYDVKQRRTFLKRTKSEFKIHDFFIGATLNVLARQLTIQGYGDDFTKAQLQKKLERSFALVKPHAYAQIGNVLDKLHQQGFSLCRARMIQFTQALANKLLASDFEESPLYKDAVASLEGDHCLALDLIKNDAVGALKVLAGPETVEEARKTAPDSLRAKFGSSGLKNGIHVSHSAESAQRQLDLIFGEASKEIERTAQFRNCTLALIRPHALLSGSAGKIVDAILKAGYKITDLELFQLDRANAEEFIEVYKGVLPEYHLMLDQLTSGPLLALEVSGVSNIVAQFREFAGPSDPELGKQIRPQSLRARFGVDKVKNAVHVTDLPEDGGLEVQYFFKILMS